MPVKAENKVPGSSIIKHLVDTGQTVDTMIAFMVLIRATTGRLLLFNEAAEIRKLETGTLVENRAEEASNSWGPSSPQSPLTGGIVDQPHCVTIHDASTGSEDELHEDINTNMTAPSLSPVHLDEAKGPANDVQTAENRGLLNKDHCIIIQGLPQSSTSTPRERVAADYEQFQKLLNDMLQPTEDVTVLKAFRLGSRTTADPQKRPRPLKIVLGSNEQAKLILSRRFRLKHSHKGVFFQPDYSPAERMKRHELVQELRTRQTNGQKNLTIYKDRIVKRPSDPLWIKSIRMTAQIRQ
ncbi:hypothetical protein SprV_0200642600 [Sparganum proliferum]